MKAGPVEVGALLQNRQRFCVPIYQRHYVWSEAKQWEPFWNDIRTKAIERLAGRERRFSHFMGAVVLEARGGHSSKQVKSYQVVDGQQRLTTFQIFLAAARDYAKAIGYETAASRIALYLLNSDPQLMEDEEVEVFKVWPTQYDRDMFTNIISLADREELKRLYSQYRFATKDKFHNYKHTPKLIAGYGFFYDKIKHAVETDDLDDEFFEVPMPSDDNDETPVAEEKADNDIPKELRLDAIWQSLVEEFKIVEITLDEGDDAQVIFETLNERGEPLLAADLVRNNIFQRADAIDRTAEKLFDKYWKIFEDPFWSHEEKQGRYKKPRIEFFLANYISAKIASEVNLTKLFSEYKAFIKKSPFANIEAELQELNRLGDIYARIIRKSGEDALAKFARRLAHWDVTTVFPLVLRIWDSADLGEAEKSDSLDLLMSFIVRRAVCGLTTKNYNKFFLTVIDHLDEAGFSYENLSKFLIAQTAASGRFPANEEFKLRWVNSPVYSNLTPSRVRGILEELELAMRGRFQEVVTLKEGLTVEHLLPQEWEKKWPLPDGTVPNSDDMLTAYFADEDETTTVGRIVKRNRLKHAIGNLTLLTQPLNSSASNSQFDKKWEKIGKQTLLMVSKDPLSEAAWDESKIEGRGTELFKLAVDIWPEAKASVGQV